MLAIVSGHLLCQSGLVELEGFLAMSLGSGLRIGVNVFLIIGVWFMVDAEFRPERIVKLYLEVLFYSLPITVCMVFLGEAGNIRNVIQGVFPFFGRSVWFASAYISLIALSPFLNQFFARPSSALRVLLCVLFLLFCIVPTIPCSTPLDYVADFSWFCVIYIVVGIIKREKLLDRIRGTKRFLLAGGVLYFALAAMRSIPAVRPIADYWVANIKALPNFLCAFLVFIGFLRLDIGVVKWINLAARSVFAVYIIHQVPAFIQFQWTTLFHADALAGASQIALVSGVVGISLSVFVGASVIDFIRLRYIEPHYMASKPVKWMISKISSFYENGIDCSCGRETDLMCCLPTKGNEVRHESDSIVKNVI